MKLYQIIILTGLLLQSLYSGEIDFGNGPRKYRWVEKSNGPGLPSTSVLVWDDTPKQQPKKQEKNKETRELKRKEDNKNTGDVKTERVNTLDATEVNNIKDAIIIFKTQLNEKEDRNNPNVEYYSIIFKRKGKMFIANLARGELTKDATTGDMVTRVPYNCQEGDEFIAVIHSHPEGISSDKFSSTDIKFLQEGQKIANDIQYPDLYMIDKGDVYLLSYEVNKDADSRLYEKDGISGEMIKL